jgi:hypothetical protein
MGTLQKDDLKVFQTNYETEKCRRRWRQAKIPYFPNVGGKT